jgi:hypothetical protein
MRALRFMQLPSCAESDVPREHRIPRSRSRDAMGGAKAYSDGHEQEPGFAADISRLRHDTTR